MIKGSSHQENVRIPNTYAPNRASNYETPNWQKWKNKKTNLEL